MPARAKATLGVVILTAILCGLDLSGQAGATGIPRTPDGHPDLQGFWTNGTITPLLRPPEFADKEFFTAQEAAEFQRTALPRLLQGEPRYTYLDRLSVVEGGRTSLIVDPPNGRFPPRAPQYEGREVEPVSADDPEARTLDERCLLGMAAGSSSAAPPMIPNPFNGNFYQIVQTPDHVMILAELIHDARIIRLNGRHLAPAVRSWLGDSIGRWEGDSLVVETVNFTEKSAWRGSSDQLRVVERFTRTDADTIQYRATVQDPERWARPWTMEIPFKATDQPVFEYACHEANYTLGNILRGARMEEQTR